MEDIRESVDRIQGYLIQGVQPLPFVYFEFLSQLYTLSKRRKLCLTPLALLEYYNLKVNIQMQNIIARRQQRKRRVA